MIRRAAATQVWALARRWVSPGRKEHQNHATD
jgi:hypothetical protein